MCVVFRVIIIIIYFVCFLWGGILFFHPLKILRIFIKFCFPSHVLGFCTLVVGRVYMTLTSFLFKCYINIFYHKGKCVVSFLKKNLLLKLMRKAFNSFLDA